MAWILVTSAAVAVVVVLTVALVRLWVRVARLSQEVDAATERLGHAAAELERAACGSSTTVPPAAVKIVDSA